MSVFTLYTVCHQQDEPQGCSSQHLPCTSAETTHDMLTDLHQSFVLNWSIPRGSPGMGKQDSSLLFSVCSSTFLYTSVNPSPNCNTETTSVYLGTKNERLLESMLRTNESSHSAWLDHCKMGKWWKQDAETVFPGVCYRAKLLQPVHFGSQKV